MTPQLLAWRRVPTRVPCARLVPPSGRRPNPCSITQWPRRGQRNPPSPQSRTRHPRERTPGWTLVWQPRLGGTRHRSPMRKYLPRLALDACLLVESNEEESRKPLLATVGVPTLDSTPPQSRMMIQYWNCSTIVPSPARGHQRVLRHVTNQSDWEKRSLFHHTPPPSTRHPPHWLGDLDWQWPVHCRTLPRAFQTLSNCHRRQYRHFFLIQTWNQGQRLVARG
mmetsp:Transcript_23892/g.39507  ORF Transcript_23892/g.39507 Transcript_23892/m.39507 type:complete len:223 (+) Transcript_23892:767-1435(+)